MKTKKVKIGIKDLDQSLKEFVAVGEAIQTGDAVKKTEGVYFTSFEAFRKALTKKRLELMHIIKTQKPSSINQLARLANRNIKNVADDVKYLCQMGLVEREETKNEVSPTVTYDSLVLEIAI